MSEVQEKARAAKDASRMLATAGTEKKNAALAAMAEEIDRQSVKILDANAQDIDVAREKNLSDALIERLTLTEKRLTGMQNGLRQVRALPDPIGEILGGGRRPNGLQISKLRVPLGVLGIIYESRPNVTVDAAGLCLKSGNCVVLRGGSEAICSNTALANALGDALESVNLPRACIGFIETTSREAARELMTANGLIDCLIPRGGANLIRTVVETATVPVIETGTGNCHVFVDESADFAMASKIILNAKVSRPSVCNSLETLLVHRQIADVFLPKMLTELVAAGVELRGDSRSRQFHPDVLVASDDDYFAEFSALVLAVKVVENLDDAIAHISYYGTRHSEAIVTSDYASAQKFCDFVDAAAVYVNASTRFTDGEEFGFGAEIGISNQKLHARGPMGLEELTTYKYVIRGDGQIRE